MQHEKLEQLKRLVMHGGFDEESRDSVIQLEIRLQKAAETEKLKDIPAIKDYLAYMKGEILRCETLLKSDESLTDLQRNKLFAIIHVSEKYVEMFDGTAVRNVEASIDEALNIAKS